MPVLQKSTYKPPPFFANGHIQSAYPVYFRKVHGVQYRRERIATPDDDFLDLDWSKIGSDKVVIILHGLEGHSYRPYMRGMAKAFNKRGWDAAAMNFRGCSGKPNRLLISYHHGKTDDLHTVVSQVMSLNRYTAMALVGFSLGANVILKYLGDGQLPVSDTIIGAAGISAPCDLTSCAWKLARRSHRFYMQRFLAMLHKKVKAKAALFPDRINDSDYSSIKNFKQFDDRYTAPIHGFVDAEDYWTQCSTTQFLSGIAKPTLIINALDDPFLTEKCFPFKEAEQSRNLFFEAPKSGGHVGFVTFGKGGEYWHEARVAEFCKQQM
jgi:predicted alpha/beta-fold hydrolase